MIPPEQIAQDFAQLAKISKCVRTYSVENGLDKAPELARKAGLKLILGIWLGRRVVVLMWRDDLDTAFRHLNLYDRFGCPGGHGVEGSSPSALTNDLKALFLTFRRFANR